MLNSQKHLYKERPVLVEIKRNHICGGKILLKQEFSDGLQISTDIEIFTIPLIIHYYLLRLIKNTTQIFHTLNRNVGFFQVSARGVGIILCINA